MEPEISNLSLYKLYESEPLSNETLFFCQSFHLYDTLSIVQFYDLNLIPIIQLKYIHPDQEKLNRELNTVYQKYIQLIHPADISLKNRQDILFVSLTELSQRENMPNWLTSRCNENGLFNLNAILTHYRKEKSFLGLRLTGTKMNQLLIELCHKYEDLETRLLPDPLKIAIKSVQKLIESMSVTQVLAFNHFVQIQTGKISSSYLYFIKILLKCRYDLPDLKALLFYDDNQIKAIYKIDILSAANIICIRNKTNEYLDAITAQKEDEDYYINLLNIILPGINQLNYDQKHQFSGFDFQKGLPVFKTIDFLLENNLLLKNVNKLVFRKDPRFFNDIPVICNSKLADELSRSVTLINHKINEVSEKFDKTFSFLKSFDRAAFNLYGFNENNNLIFMDDKLVNEINKTEGTHFTARFITKIFSIIYSDSYELIGGDVKHSYCSGNEWNNYYLFSLRQNIELDIYMFIENFIYILSRKVIKTYTFSVVDKLNSNNNTGKSPDKDLLDSIKFILLKEYGLMLDENYNFLIKKNTNKSIKEAVFEIMNKYRRSISAEQMKDYMYREYQYQKSEENERILIKYLDKNPRFMSYINFITGCKEWMEKIVS